MGWLTTYPTDQTKNGRWIITLGKYHFQIEHRPRTQLRNADGFSKQKNGYKKHEWRLGERPPVSKKWNFLSQEVYDNFSLVPWYVVQGRIIPNHPEPPSHLRKNDKKLSQTTLKVASTHILRLFVALRERARKMPLPTLPLSDFSILIETYPEYPKDWIELTEECKQDYLLPTHIANVPSRTTYSLTGVKKQALYTAPKSEKLPLLSTI